MNLCTVCFVLYGSILVSHISALPAINNQDLPTDSDTVTDPVISLFDDSARNANFNPHRGISTKSNDNHDTKADATQLVEEQDQIKSHGSWSRSYRPHSHNPHRHNPHRHTPHSHLPHAHSSSAAAVGDPGGKCKQGQAGICGPTLTCKGRLVSGYCNGNSDNVCCTPRSSSGGPLPTPLFSPGGNQGKRERFLLAAIKDFGIGGTEAAQFMAQMCHESDSFKAMEEYASGDKYEGRQDLGNTQPGDGRRYKGRGFIQITGRANYREYGKQLGIDLEHNPSKASDPIVAAKVAIAYWRRRVEPKTRDFADTVGVTKRINGGTNGLADRQQKFGLYSGKTKRPAGSFGAPCKSSYPGICGDPSDCRTKTVGGYCSGGSDNSCCPITADDSTRRRRRSLSQPHNPHSHNPHRHNPHRHNPHSHLPHAHSSSAAAVGDPGGKCKQGQAGTCGNPSTCKGRLVSGYCNGGADNVCCDMSTSPPAPPVGNGCGSYSGSLSFKIAGNQNVIYDVVKIRKEDLTYPSVAQKKPTQKDNTMTVKTACAFSRLQAGAASAGYRLTINSGFRVLARQTYFWNCYQEKLSNRPKPWCNNGNKAARPGTSNHGTGIALDLNLSTSAYGWMRNNAARYGFIRTVSSETWHWEYRPGSACNAKVQYACT
jgi:predicted chitinase